VGGDRGHDSNDFEIQRGGTSCFISYAICICTLDPSLYNTLMGYNLLPLLSRSDLYML
jgi:hypothetical protein